MKPTWAQNFNHCCFCHRIAAHSNVRLLMTDCSSLEKQSLPAFHRCQYHSPPTKYYLSKNNVANRIGIRQEYCTYNKFRILSMTKFWKSIHKTRRILIVQTNKMANETHMSNTIPWYLSNYVLYFIVLVEWSLLTSALRTFQDLLCSPNLGTTRKWICRLNVVQRPIFQAWGSLTSLKSQTRHHR